MINRSYRRLVVGNKEFFMKNLKILSAILTTALILTLTFASCGGGGGGGGTPADNSGGTGGSGGNKNPTSRVYESTDTSDNVYILKVTSASSKASVSRAAYTPKSGDTFTLTIIITSLGETWTDSGTVSTSGTTLTLSGKETSSLTITVSKNGNDMIKIEVPSGTTITLDNGNTFTIPNEDLKATKLPDPTTIKLVANNNDDGPNWAYARVLSDITNVKPKPGLKYKFRVSGTTDKTMETPSLSIEAHTKDWVKDADGNDYQWLGGVEGQVRLSGTFEETFLIPIYFDPKTGYIVQVTLYNNDAVPANAILNETVLATIKNFELRLIGIEK